MWCASSLLDDESYFLVAALLRVMLSHRIIAYYDLIRASLSLPPVYVLSSGSLPYGLVWAGNEKVPNLSCLSFPTVPSSVPRRLGDCLKLLLHRPLWPSPSSQKVGDRLSTLAGSMRGSCNEAAKFALCYGPMELLALLRQGRLHSSFHLLGLPLRVSSMTTRANNQFPRPDFHRLDKQPYRLRTKHTKERTCNRTRHQKFRRQSCRGNPRWLPYSKSRIPHEEDGV